MRRVRIPDMQMKLKRLQRRIRLYDGWFSMVIVGVVLVPLAAILLS